MSFLVFVALFLLPIFPFSLIVNRLLDGLNAKLFSLSIFLFFVFGNVILFYINLDSKIIEYFALFTIFFYSFRLLGVMDLKKFVLYMYPIVSSFSWLWYLMGGDILESLVIKGPVFMLFLYLYGFLAQRFTIVHQKSLRGLGGSMPRWSVLFILSLLGIISSMLFLGYKFLEIEFLRLSLFYGLILICSWVLINWGSIKVIEWLIYGAKRDDVHCDDLSNLELSLSIVLLVSSLLISLFYGTRGLA